MTLTSTKLAPANTHISPLGPPLRSLSGIRLMPFCSTENGWLVSGIAGACVTVAMVGSSAFDPRW